MVHQISLTVNVSRASIVKVVRKPCNVELVELASPASSYVGGTDEEYSDDA